MRIGSLRMVGDERAWAAFAEVPEPGTATLLGLGLAGLVIVGRSRRERNESSSVAVRTRAAVVQVSCIPNPGSVTTRNVKC